MYFIMEKRMKPTICAIAAVGPQNAIGIDDRIPWHSKADFYHFKKTTLGHPCIFGRKTYQGLPKRPLPDRLNIICSTQHNNIWGQDGVFLASSIESAIEQSQDLDQIFICGGAAIYEYVLNHDLIDVFYLTKIFSPVLANQIKENPGRYTYFPKDLDTFFSPDKWHPQQIIYPCDILPIEKSPIQATFYKFIRTR
jgi:dihydrofolate reductase